MTHSKKTIAGRTDRTTLPGSLGAPPTDSRELRMESWR